MRLHLSIDKQHYLNAASCGSHYRLDVNLIQYLQTKPLDTPVILKSAEKKARLTSRAFSFYNEWHQKCVKGKIEVRT
jgi:hypothetical protein